MKAVVTESVKNRKYPYLGLSTFGTGTIALFISHKCGVILKSKALEVGSYQSNLDEPNFTEMKGSITLSND